MGMDRERNVFRQCRHFDGQRAFGDHIPRAHPDDSHAQHPLRGWIKNQFRHSFGAVERHGTTGSGPGKLRDLDLAAFFFRLSFRHTGPGDLGIGEDHGGNSIGLERDLMSGDVFHRSASFMGSVVSEHGLADYIADGVNRGSVGMEMLIGLEEAAWADADLSAVKAANFGIWFAPHRDQNLVENLFAFFYVFAVEAHANAVRFFLHRSYGGV